MSEGNVNDQRETIINKSKVNNEIQIKIKTHANKKFSYPSPFGQ